MSGLRSAPIPGSVRTTTCAVRRRAAADRVRRLRVSVLRRAARAAGRPGRPRAGAAGVPPLPGALSASARVGGRLRGSRRPGCRAASGRCTTPLLADQARLEDPHLWDRAESLGLDLDRFEADRRGEPVSRARPAGLQRGVRGGVVTTPTVIWQGALATRRAGCGALLERVLGARRVAAPAGRSNGREYSGVVSAARTRSRCLLDRLGRQRHGWSG